MGCLNGLRFLTWRLGLSLALESLLEANDIAVLQLSGFQRLLRLQRLDHGRFNFLASCQGVEPLT